MACLLPPQCLFCRRFFLNSGIDDPDCEAFHEIPDAIFRGEFDHTRAFPGDRGLRFVLDAELAEEFAEINGMREKAGLEAFRDS